MIHELLYKTSQEKQRVQNEVDTKKVLKKSREGGRIIVLRICHKCVYIICYWLSQKEDSQQ